MRQSFERMAWILAVAAAGLAVEAAQVEVLRDRVCLRARPKAEAEVAGQVDTGLVLESRGQAGEWVEVAPPATLGLWVSSVFVQNGKVVPVKLNVRAGAGINYPVVGSLAQGEPVNVRARLGEWMEIVPPTNASLWIAREYVKFLPDPAAVPAGIKSEPPPAVAVVPPPKPEPVKPKPVRPEPTPISPPVQAPPPRPPAPAPPAPPPEVSERGLVPLDGQGEAMEREGVLQKTGLFDFGKLSNYGLVDRERGRPVTVCYIRGNNAQLKQFEGRRMRVKGDGYWVKGGSKPVLVPRQIMPLPDNP